MTNYKICQTICCAKLVTGHIYVPINEFVECLSKYE